MADWFVGKATHCSDANGGTTWADAKLTITSLLGVAYAAGDRLLAGPGVYREQVTLNGSGATVDNTGTIDVTNESTAITGNGTNWVAAAPPLPVVAGDQVFVGNLVTAANGQTYGTSNFQVAGGTGNFQAGMEGYMIEIITKGAYIIGTVNSTTNITLLDPHHAAGAEVWPAASGGFNQTFYVVSGEGSYEVAGGIAAATLTLDKPWSGPTLTAVPYEIYRPVYLIADTTGVETDGVGGQVRVCDTDDDETWAGRNNCFFADTRNYWIIRGFLASNSGGWHFWFDTCSHITVEDCTTIDVEDFSFELYECTQMTLRRDIILGCAGDSSGYGIYIQAPAPVDNTQNLIENVYIDQFSPITIRECGGTTVKNCNNGFRSYIGISAATMNVGSAVFVHDCCLHFCDDRALEANVLGEMVEQYCSLFQNQTDRFRVGAAAPPPESAAFNSVDYLYLPSLPLLGDGVRWPMVPFFAPSEWDATRALAGLYPKNEDLFGVHNEVAQTRRSWGPMQQYPTKRETTVAYGSFTAAMDEPDAMEQHHVYNAQEERTYTIAVQVYLDAAYTGNNPQMIVSQPGQADVTATSTGAIGAWEQLSASFTTGADLDWISIFLKSRNTSALPNRSVRWQDLTVI